MIELLKEEVKIGETLKLILTTGKEITGEVIEFGSNHVLLKDENGKSTRIFEVLIGGWELIGQQKNTAEIHNDTISGVDTTPVQIDQGLKDNINIKNEIEVDQNSVVEENIIESEANPRIRLKVVGKIDLDKTELTKSRFNIERSFRLRQVVKDFNSTINIIVNFLATKNIIIESNPNIKISQSVYNILSQNKEKLIGKTSNDGSNENKLENESLGLTLNSFSQLSKLKEKIDINVGKQLLPANAKIKRYGSFHQYGFITASDGLDYHFRFNDIQDKSLLEKLQNFGAEGTQVICQLNNNYGKLTAKKIYLPQTVEYFQNKAEKFFLVRNYIDALEIIELILSHFPDNSQSIELKNKIRSKTKKEVESKTKENAFYITAKVELKRGNIEIAKKNFLKAIESDDKKAENAIKELAYILSGENKHEEAISLVKENFNKIKLSDPNSFLAYFYETIKDYTSAIDYLRKIKPKTDIESLKISKRLALCYFGKANYSEAEVQINKILKIQPTDLVTNKLKQALDIAKAEGSEEEIDSIFKEAEISALTGGLSKYIYFTLENCEYSGVPDSEKVKGTFNRKTLVNLRKYIETIKDGRPRERAEAYLSQAKITQLLFPENSRLINEALGRYCTSIAISWATEGKHNDTVRYLLLEASALEPVYDILRRYLPLYLHSYTLSGFEAKSKIRQNWSELIEEVVLLNESPAFWFGVLDLLLVNSKFSTQFLTSLYNTKEYRERSLMFLIPFLEETVASEINKDDFLLLWKKGRERLKREKDGLSAKLLSLEQSKSTEALTESFQNIIQNLPKWVCQLDRQRIDSMTDIIESIIDFNKQHAFEDKERYFNIIINQLDHLKEEIQESPTEISFNIFISVIDFINTLIVSEFKTIIETSKPVINIQIYGEGSINKTTGVVDVQFSISNKRGRAPISFLELNIKDENGIVFIKENNSINQSIKGGDEKVLKLRLIVDKTLFEVGATNLSLNCYYKIRGSDELLMQDEELTLRFYSITDFIKIENPFAATADSGPVVDDSMFYGREEFISAIKDSIMNSKSKCIIIYGQKRSGKSSVLHHLRKKLNGDPNAFCISFSLGEIIEDLSPKTFYYTILTEIEDSLALISEHNDNTPEYFAPDFSDLSENPNIIFNDQIKTLKREFNKVPTWSNKKLVLLIDEFTYIYTAIKKEYLSEQFMKTWKSFLEKGFFTSVLIGQDIMPKFKATYPNEFGVTEDKRLSYLKKTDAVKLIEEPIWDKTKNRSRFLGKATELILDYTSSNPYYVQIFCARLVDYMNDNKAISVTEADIRDVADAFIRGGQALPADKFDNLITAGDADVDSFNPHDVLSALKAIAIASKNLDSCPRDAINLGDIEYEERILKDLRDREVLSCPQPGYYKINVRLFKEWLLIN